MSAVIADFPEEVYNDECDPLVVQEPDKKNRRSRANSEVRDLNSNNIIASGHKRRRSSLGPKSVQQKRKLSLASENKKRRLSVQEKISPEVISLISPDKTEKLSPKKELMQCESMTMTVTVNGERKVSLEKKRSPMISKKVLNKDKTSPKKSTKGAIDVSRKIKVEKLSPTKKKQKSPKAATPSTSIKSSPTSGKSLSTSVKSSPTSGKSSSTSVKNLSTFVKSSPTSGKSSPTSGKSSSTSGACSSVSGQGSDVTAEEGNHAYRCKVGQEVLARWSDGLFYLGRVCKVDRARGSCLIIYEDKSSFWALYKDLQNVPSKPLTIDEMVCNHCQGGDSNAPDQIVICDNCGIGYHQRCHKPAISDSALTSRESWHCRLCVFVSSTKKGGALKKGASAKLFSKVKLSLPYEPSSLDWDEDHLSNKQQTYCYCGGPGEWSTKMLQCCRCDQWFHEACLQCLDQPLLLGDRCYVFVCGVCNFGNEYIKRVPLDWLEILQLALFNMHVSEEESQGFDTNDVCTWIARNMTLLQLDQSFHTLTSSTLRFHAGRKLAKHRQFLLWRRKYSLRERAPPARPRLVLPPGILDDTIVGEVIAAARVDIKVEKRGRPKSRPKSRQSLPGGDVIRPRLVKEKKSSSTTSLLRLDDVIDSVTSGTETDTTEIADDGKAYRTDDNNNNTYWDSESQNGTPGFFSAIPYLDTFQGIRHPFKTALEKEEELKFEKKKSQILAQYGAVYKPDSSVLKLFSAQEEAAIRKRNLHIVELLKKKKGRKSVKEKKILEIANEQGSRKRKRSVSPSKTLIEGFAKNEKLQKGDGCDILGRRVLPGGEVQYLISWNGLA